MSGEEQISERVLAALEARGMSQNKLEGEAELSLGYVNKLIKLKRKPGPTNAKKIARVLGVSVEWLLYGTGRGLGSVDAGEERYPNAVIAAQLVREADVEDMADALAGALVAPRDAYRLALREVGLDLPALANDFRASQSCVALRLGEVTGRPIVLVAPRLRSRGEAFGWPSERALRRLARAEVMPDGVERRILTDDAKRVVLMAA